MGRAQSNLEEKSRNPYKVTFGYLGEIVDKAEVIENKHRWKKEEDHTVEEENRAEISLDTINKKDNKRKQLRYA